MLKVLIVDGGGIEWKDQYLMAKMLLKAIFCSFKEFGRSFEWTGWFEFSIEHQQFSQITA